VRAVCDVKGTIYV